MSLATSFSEFLSEIRPTKADNDRARQRHTELRENLLADKHLAPIIIHTFLQGSYKRATILRPTEKDKMDVDLVVVTTIDENVPPSYAFKMFEPFVSQHYPNQWELQGRSIGIKLKDVELDLVITARPEEILVKSMAALDYAFAEHNGLATPPPNWLRRLTANDDTVEDWFEEKFNSISTASFSESRENLTKSAMDSADEWRLHPLRIPDRETKEWQDTHPLAQIEWTKGKNAATNGHFVNIVKAIKWWKRETPDLPKYPKSYPLEHMIGQCCPDNITSFDDGLRATLEAIANTYRRHADTGVVPELSDHGCPDVNVLSRVDADDFQQFHRGIDRARETACRASDCKDEAEAAKVWGSLLGPVFPLLSVPTEPASAGGFTQRERRSEVSEGRFA